MAGTEKKVMKAGILAGVVALTLGIHYGWLIEPFFGHVHWLHAIHGRFCYIPIVVASVWFGLRGGLVVAAVISALLMPYLLDSGLDSQQLADELTEIVFYFAIALLSGALVDRELRARKKTQEARLQLERSQKLSLVGQIAAGMAHEIKNPLASIKGAIEILGDESTPASEKKEFRGIVVKEIKRINRSVVDFLEFARPTETRPSRVHLSEVARGSIKQIETQAREHAITIIDDIDDGVYVIADEEKVHQVLLNLLINAIEASDTGKSVSVALKLRPGNKRAVVTVEDDGMGIPAADSDRVFEPFFSSKPTGSGLGLSIAKSIVERHGGVISIEGKSGGGARATVELPIRDEE